MWSIIYGFKQTFDFLVDDFLLAKLVAYGYSYESLKLINSIFIPLDQSSSVASYADDTTLYAMKENTENWRKGCLRF